MASLREEHGLRPMRLEGTLPGDLTGTLYRNGPSLMESADGRRYGHLFDGDGAISAVRFEGGRALGGVRVVQSTGLREERAAGARIYGGYGTRSRKLTLDPSKRAKNAANTSVLRWGSRLLALWEGGRPTELDPDTLETLGETDLEGAVLASFSAHPSRVASRDRIYNFGVRYGRRAEIDVYELAPTGVARRLTSLPLAWASMVHDFVATERYLVFLVPPLKARMLRLLLGLTSYSDSLAWRPELGTEVIVVPIDQPDRPVRFTVEPFYQWHFANAFERGGDLVVDLVRYRDFASNEWLRTLQAGTPEGAFDGRYHRMVIEPAQRRARSEVVWDRPCEFPRVAPAVDGRAHRFAYVAAHSSPAASSAGLHDRVARVDAETGAVVETALGPSTYPSEPVFVPRPGATAEDDGWVLTLVYDAVAHASHVAVLDARRLDAGPLARAWFDQPIPFTFHGVFHPAG